MVIHGNYGITVRYYLWVVRKRQGKVRYRVKRVTQLLRNCTTREFWVGNTWGVDLLNFCRMNEVQEIMHDTARGGKVRKAQAVGVGAEVRALPSMRVRTWARRFWFVYWLLRD